MIKNTSTVDRALVEAFPDYAWNLDAEEHAAEVSPFGAECGDNPWWSTLLQKPSSVRVGARPDARQRGANLASKPVCSVQVRTRCGRLWCNG